MVRFLTCVLIALACAQSLAQNTGLWQTQNIYQVITDRFFDGDPSNNSVEGTYDPAGHRGTSVHGGDFRGLEQKLDYVKSLGATAVWISPIVLNARGEFHGYAGYDFYRVAPHWGSLADLQQMVQAAHARGILIIADVVVNHGGDLIDSGDPGYGRFRSPPEGYHLRWRDPKRQYPPPFNLSRTNTTLESLFHNHGLIQNYQNTQQSELGELFGLDDFATETDYVRQRMIEIADYWIEHAGFDGFRVDTVQHVEMGFWQNWCPAIRRFAATHGKPEFFMFGEVLNGSDAKCGSYTGQKAGGADAFDSVLDYPLFFKIRKVFGRVPGNPAQLADRFSGLHDNYDPRAETQLVTFLDNHDQPRFLSPEYGKNTFETLKLALSFLYTSQGIPCLYYGTEQGFNGGNDPFDREDMFAGQFEQGPSLGDNFNMTHPLFQWIAKLNNLRRLYPALHSGKQIMLSNGETGPGLLAWSRTLGSATVLILLNTSEETRTVPALPTAHPPGARLVDVLDPNHVLNVNDTSGLPPFSLPPSSIRVFVAASEVRPLDPVVTIVSPAHDAKDCASLAPVRLRFSQPMNTKSAETAFSTLPKVPGAFTWSNDRDEMTFTPTPQGWPPGSMVAVKLLPTAKAENGQPFYAGFESRFQTAGKKQAVDESNSK